MRCKRGFDFAPILFGKDALGERHYFALFFAHVFAIMLDVSVHGRSESRELAGAMLFIPDECLLKLADRFFAEFMLESELIKNGVGLARALPDSGEKD